MISEAPPLIDTHAHLDSEQFGNEVAEIIARARTANVVRIVNIGYRLARWETTLALADRFPEIAFTLGLHPHHAEEWSDETERLLCEYLTLHRPIAVGEIGLDFNRNLNPPHVQEQVFRRQLAIAAEFGLPVVIHQRDAENEVLAVLRETPKSLACVLHSFEGSTKLADFATDRGYLLGVGGIMTRAKSTSLREVLRTVPLELLVLETDSPYLVPAKVKHQRNEPANVARIAENLSTLHGVSIDDLAKVTTNNAERVFGPLVSH